MVATPQLSRRWVVTGARGAGKTTFCRRIAEIAQGADWDVAGLLSPPRMEGSGRTGIFVVDLRSGAQRLLASLDPLETGGPRMGSWSFSAPALRWADEVLARATPCDLLVVDEIGPLELKLRQGLSAWRGALHSDRYRAALAVVRPVLEEEFRLDWERGEKLLITSPDQAQGLAGAVFSGIADTDSQR